MQKPDDLGARRARDARLRELIGILLGGKPVTDALRAEIGWQLQSLISHPAHGVRRGHTTLRVDAMRALIEHHGVRRRKAAACVVVDQLPGRKGEKAVDALLKQYKRDKDRGFPYALCVGRSPLSEALAAKLSGHE